MDQDVNSERNVECWKVCVKEILHKFLSCRNVHAKIQSVIEINRNVVCYHWYMPTITNYRNYDQLSTQSAVRSETRSETKSMGKAWPNDMWRNWNELGDECCAGFEVRKRDQDHWPKKKLKNIIMHHHIMCPLSTWTERNHPIMAHVASEQIEHQSQRNKSGHLNFTNLNGWHKKVNVMAHMWCETDNFIQKHRRSMTLTLRERNMVTGSDHRTRRSRC